MDTGTGTPRFLRLTFDEIEKLYHFMCLRRAENIHTPLGRQKYYHVDLQVYQAGGIGSIVEAKHKEHTYDITDYDSF